MPVGDLIAPEIKQSPITTNILPGELANIRATVTDNAGVKSVTIFYRNTGAVDFKRTEMMRELGTDHYAATLPEIIAPSVEYYIRATDHAENAILHGHTFSPLTITVLPAQGGSAAVADPHVAPQKDAAAKPVITKANISQRELALFLIQFIRSYEDGDLLQFMRLFSENAKIENRMDRKGIEEDYKDLFNKSVARRFILGDLKWEHNNDKAEGEGFFEVKIWPKGGNNFKTFTGEVMIEVLKTKTNQLVITGLFHRF